MSVWRLIWASLLAANVLLTIFIVLERRGVISRVSDETRRRLAEVNFGAYVVLGLSFPSLS